MSLSGLKFFCVKPRHPAFSEAGPNADIRPGYDPKKVQIGAPRSRES